MSASTAEKSRSDEAAASVARNIQHEERIKNCMEAAAWAGARSFLVTGVVSTAAVLAATRFSPWFRSYLGPSGKTGLAVSGQWPLMSANSPPFPLGAVDPPPSSSFLLTTPHLHPNPTTTTILPSFPPPVLPGPLLRLSHRGTDDDGLHEIKARALRRIK